MSLRDTLRVIQSGQRRLKIFVDFWNVIINARQQTSFDIDVRWDKVAEQLVGETRVGHIDETSGELAGCYVFGSFSKSNSAESAFVDRTLDRYGSLPGIFFDFKERVRKETSNKCSKCGERVSRSSELGVDVLLTVEMIKHASIRDHDYFALVSSDRDYLPLLTYLKDQGQRVLHVATGEAHRDMRSMTWKQIELGEHYPSLCTINHAEIIVLTAPGRDEKLEEAKAVLEGRQLRFNVLDITDRNAINDKDLSFILRNQNMYFRGPDYDGRTRYSAENLSGSLYDFRKALRAGEVDGDLPYIIRNGRMEAYPSDEWGWIVNGEPEVMRAWEQVRSKPTR